MEETLPHHLCRSGHILRAGRGSPALLIVLGQEDQSEGCHAVRPGLLGLRETSQEEPSAGLGARTTACCRDLGSIVPSPRTSEGCPPSEPPGLSPTLRCFARQYFTHVNFLSSHLRIFQNNALKCLYLLKQALLLSLTSVWQFSC